MKNLKQFMVCGLTSLALVACGSNTEESAAEAETSNKASPNIIFILTDDQGWTSVGYPSDPANPDSQSDYMETPNMAALAGQGMRFSQAYTPNPICAPARHAMLFGQRATRHIYNRDETWIDRAPEWLTIPKAIKAANPDYRTAYFGKWHVGLTPKQAGFDYSDGLTDNTEGDMPINQYMADKKYVPQDVMDAYNEKNNIDTTPANQGARDRSQTFYPSDDPKAAFSLTARASDFIREAVADGKPFYTRIAHYAVHQGISAKQESFDKFNAKPHGNKHDNPAFAAMTYDLDAAIGEVTALVKELGIEDNTYIIVMGDNGGVAYYTQTSIIDENLNILDTYRTKVAAERNAPLRSGKHSFYEGGIRVPFIIAGPNIEANSSSNEPITGVDLLPTFARLAGFDGALEGPLDGEDFGAIIDGADETTFERENPTLIFHQAGRRNPDSAVRQGKYKLIKHWARKANKDGTMPPDTLELYNLDADLGEKNDLSEQHPEIVADLHAKLLAHIAETNSEYTVNNRTNPMDIILEREGLDRNKKNRQQVTLEYVSPYKK